MQTSCILSCSTGSACLGALCNIPDPLAMWSVGRSSWWIHSRDRGPKVKVNTANNRSRLKIQSKTEPCGAASSFGHLNYATILHGQHSSAFWPWRCPIVCLIWLPSFFIFSYFSFAKCVKWQSRKYINAFTRGSK